MPLPDPLQFGFETIEVRQGTSPYHSWETPDGDIWMEFHRHDADFVINLPDYAAFRLSCDGTSIGCDPLPGVPDQTLEHLFQNQIKPLMLSHLGFLVFHGSCVNTGGDCAGFVGESGKGKSTLAASFASNQNPFLADDGLVLDMSDDEVLVQPGHDSVRLWPDSRAAIGFSPGSDELADSKIRVISGDRLQHTKQSLRLAGVYVLAEEKPQIEIESLAPNEAVVELVKHSFLLDVESTEQLTQQFNQIVQLVKQVGVYNLSYPRDYAALVDVRTAIVEHMHQAKDAIG